VAEDFTYAEGVNYSKGLMTKNPSGSFTTSEY
jgi:hypothetical protein